MNNGVITVATVHFTAPRLDMTDCIPAPTPHRFLRARALQRRRDRSRSVRPGRPRNSTSQTYACARCDAIGAVLRRPTLITQMSPNGPAAAPWHPPDVTRSRRVSVARNLLQPLVNPLDQFRIMGSQAEVVEGRDRLPTLLAQQVKVYQYPGCLA